MRVLWAVRDSDLSYAALLPAERRYSPTEALRMQREEDGICLFNVLDVEKVFSPIISPMTWSGTSHNAFVGNANGMLTWGRSSHMAHIRQGYQGTPA